VKQFVRPRPGLQLRDPATGEPIPPEGTIVEWSTFWARRIRDGDVEMGSVRKKRGRVRTADTAEE